MSPVLSLSPPIRPSSSDQSIVMQEPIMLIIGCKIARHDSAPCAGRNHAYLGSSDALSICHSTDFMLTLLFLQRMLPSVLKLKSPNTPVLVNPF
jgi:hypothetical protein